MSSDPSDGGGPVSSAVRFTVLGSGTLLPSVDHTSAAYLLEAGSFRCLVDCGPGTLHGFARHGVSWEELDAIAFSHFHNDHIGDLPAVLFALDHGVRPPRTRPLTLIGPPGFRDLLSALTEAFGDHVTDPGYPLEIVELERDGSWAPDSGTDFESELESESGAEPGDGAGAATGVAVRLDVHPTPHSESSVAHRWTVGGRVLAYTGDTGPTPTDLIEFLSGADLLVAEVSLPDDTDMTNHLTPTRAALLASGARPELLVTTHVYPYLDPLEVPRLVLEAGYAGRVEAGRDGLVVEVGGSVDVVDG